MFEVFVTRQKKMWGEGGEEAWGSECSDDTVKKMRLQRTENNMK